jgi:hypothetical protein
MAQIDVRSGCKVGWETFDTLAEAEARAVTAMEQRDRMFARGYDFGYQWPGSITHHLAGQSTYEVECWTVVVP